MNNKILIYLCYYLDFWLNKYGKCSFTDIVQNVANLKKN